MIPRKKKGFATEEGTALCPRLVAQNAVQGKYGLPRVDLELWMMTHQTKDQLFGGS